MTTVCRLWTNVPELFLSRLQMRTKVLLIFGIPACFSGGRVPSLMLANGRKKVLAIRKNLLTTAVTL